MMSAGSFAIVSAHAYCGLARASSSSHGSTPDSRAPPAPITCSRCVSRPLIAHSLGSVAGSTIAAHAPACSIRYSSASGPNRCDSGSAIAPIWKIAT